MIILIPIDLSAQSKPALWMAGLLQEKLDAEIHILYVLDLPYAFNATAIGNNRNLSGLPTDEENRKYQIHVRSGDSLSATRNIACEIYADMIIMATNDHNDYDQATADKGLNYLISELEIPVLSLRSGYRLKPIEHILLVADFDFFGKGIQIGLIKMIATAFDSTIHLLQMVNKNDQQHLDLITAQIKFFAEEHQLEKYEIIIYPASWDKVTEYIHFHNWDTQMGLICIRKDRRKNFNDLLFGRIAKRLVDEYAKPLLTFKLKHYD
ncbi:universal stress protein [Mucilaginibacter sp. 10I4]|uniref:universal stress protein n=1 Tax=Mucilaginibacter sp. 10I4 TaxID=3048580 RepID=UPI002B225829|nr:universal stress protein [Mucilaginibacter sp. 10I4]MEB0260719.1 universal stress protein [Mucilaginibacter sp. 10I4]